MLLLLAGAAITGGAVFWWADFYGGLIRGTKYTLWDAGFRASSTRQASARWSPGWRS